MRAYLVGVAVLLGLADSSFAQWPPLEPHPATNAAYLEPLPSNWPVPAGPGIAAAAFSEYGPPPVMTHPQDCPLGPCAECPCDCCHCFPCECPQEPAPCIPCPHVSTLLPFWNLNFFGAIQANIQYNSARPLAPGTPFFLLPDAIFEEDTIDVHARSSYIGAALTGPQIGAFQAGGLFMCFLYNDAVIVDRYGLLPVLAYGDLKNEDWRLAAGLQFDVFSPNMPTMLVWSSLLASGNVGNNFRGQFRLERFLYPTDDTQWTIQVALSEPIATSIDPTQDVLTEDNGWPNVEMRLAWGAGPAEQVGLEVHRPLEIGASAVVGQVRETFPLVDQVIADVYGLGLDFRWKVNDRLGFVGEAFVGQGLGTYNGGVLQTTNPDTSEAIRTSGAWGEVYYYLNPCLHTHTGYAVDDPNDNDIAFDQIAKNETYYANLLWDITRQLRLGFEFTWRRTEFAIPVLDNEGVGFHTQVQFAF